MIQLMVDNKILANNHVLVAPKPYAPNECRSILQKYDRIANLVYSVWWDIPSIYGFEIKKVTDNRNVNWINVSHADVNIDPNYFFIAHFPDNTEEYFIKYFENIEKLFQSGLELDFSEPYIYRWNTITPSPYSHTGYEKVGFLGSLVLYQASSLKAYYLALKIFGITDSQIHDRRDKIESAFHSQL